MPVGSREPALVIFTVDKASLEERPARLPNRLAYSTLLHREPTHRGGRRKKPSKKNSLEQCVTQTEPEQTLYYKL